uniref:Uncharacterized protein n=1 Tax=Candidatus Kentrum sp. UNK TaxID=2126344 RepID=A0A451A0S8_9GAMM|nr:MAG: hypothetical protein BECKUNK1418G_GA0071005_100813 [Candidatus Kentron sp. UNK]VFK68822.1 MAG: hypothetical protein BECKUNK1418H_GA0071006_100642 [Candidatus Kentron sp. UNK]
MVLPHVSEKIPKNPYPRKEHPVWILLLRANMFTYRKNKNFEKPGLEIKAHPPSILARSANMFIERPSRYSTQWLNNYLG